MSDVLTPEERGAIARVNRDLGHAQNLSRTSVAWRRRLLAIIDRLVVDVERLRKTDLQWPHIITPCVCCESMRASLKEALK